MTRWVDLRRRAREKHQALVEKSGGSRNAEALLKAAETISGIRCVPLPKGDSLLAGADAVLDSEAKIIWYNKDAEPTISAFYRMHEYAHFWLHEGHRNCGKNDIDLEASEEDAPFGVARVEGYGPKELAEREANVFAREALLPSDVIRHWYLRDKMSATSIAKMVGLPEGMVHHQLSYAVLVSDLTSGIIESEKKRARPPMDPSQAESAEWSGTPLLVEAGPGTGKTRTLVGRIQHLLSKGQPAQSILALTFSNKAAEEMRSRIAEVAPSEASLIWMGTFHAFGLELLRKYGTKIELPPDPSILDPVDALFLLEQNLPALQLDRYQNLYDPAMHLRSILGAISRAKDELVGPAQYSALAQRMRTSASTEDEIEAAERAIEVARVYAFYQGYLDRGGLLDFGDLIFKSVTLLKTLADVRDELRGTYTHILVDEYQDVNRASGLLLREIAGEKDGLWVVGDTRQAIYRFRGASTENMRRFTADFPKAKTKTLGCNYRSRPEIISVFSEFAKTMKATEGQLFKGWLPKRNPSGKVHLNIAENLFAEALGLAEEIRRHFKSGIQYKDQAILCRSHTTLARIATRLEQLGVPVLYLGDLFERSEIKDLLSLISLTCQGHGSGLVRIAGFPEYGIPVDDAQCLIKESRDRKTYFPSALALAEGVTDISEKGKAGFKLLAGHLKDISFEMSAWSLLAHYLFNQSAYLKSVLEDKTTAGQQKRLAIYQFLQFAHEQRSRKHAKSEDPKRHFLDYIRSLEIYGEEKQLRQVPDWASEINAVRLLTVHASKGLEFEMVYMPALGKRYFPVAKQSNPCPAPAGMLSDNCNDNGHDEEEECLFFVALSRAREVLCLSRSKQYGSQNSNPSDLLESIKGCLPHSVDGAVTWKAKETSPAGKPLRDFSTDRVFDVCELDIYNDCPKRYYYQFVLGLPSRREDSAYVQFHKCVYDVIRWIGAERSQGKTIDESTAHLRLKATWRKFGPVDHPYESIYRRDAELMVSWASQRSRAQIMPIEPPTWTVKLKSGGVQFRPDSVEKTAENRGCSVLRVRTCRPSQSETDKPIYALYQVAMEQAFPDNDGGLGVMFVSTGEVVPVQLTQKKIKTRLDRYSNAVTGILNEYFPSNSSDRNCPRCPHYFICPAPYTI